MVQHDLLGLDRLTRHLLGGVAGLLREGCSEARGLGALEQLATGTTNPHGGGHFWPPPAREYVSSQKIGLGERTANPVHQAVDSHLRPLWEDHLDLHILPAAFGLGPTCEGTGDVGSELGRVDPRLLAGARRGDLDFVDPRPDGLDLAP